MANNNRLDRLFRIDFYPQDWLIDTARLTPEERGVFVQIVMMIYANRGPIINDEKHLANLCGCSIRLVRSIIIRLNEKNFIQISGSKIGQKRAESELKMKRNHLESSSKGGRTSSENLRKLHENEGDVNENNNLESSDPLKSLGSSTATATATATPPPEEDADAALSAREVRPYVLVGEHIARMCGWDKNPNWGGSHALVDAWIKGGWDPELDILPTVQRIMLNRPDNPPRSLKYFEPAIADAHFTRTQPLPKGKTDVRTPPRPSRTDQARAALERGRQKIFEEIESDAADHPA